LDEAQKLMFPGAHAFERLSVTLTAEQVRAIEKQTGVRLNTHEPQIWRVQRDEDLVGYFVLDDVIGKHELIHYALTLSPEGAVRQVEILDYREAYGYEIRNPAWRKQFVGRTGADRLRLDDDIRNISGATLSCRHITEGVKRALGIFRVAISK
jgi:Na+-transporting NADH:ubiquinone oxidoreductase subunit NqrC